MPVDFGRAAQDYSRYRAGFPESFYERLKDRGIGLPGQVAVDLGTGTGTMARRLAQGGCRVLGVDVSLALIRQAVVLDREAQTTVTYYAGCAEETGLPEGYADLVSAAQCWHWFNRQLAAREVRRILKAGGWVLIAHFDWLPLHGNVVEATEALILAHNPGWNLGGGYGMNPQWLRDLGEAGFTEIESFTYDVEVAFTHEAWRGRIRASAGVGATLPPERVKQFDADLARLLERRFPEQPLKVPHRVFAVFGKR